MAQALYLKWRPNSFDDMVGQEHVVQTLRNAISAGRIGHAYLFSGNRGSGKTTSARLLAKAINCLEPNRAARPCNRCSACVAVNEGRYLDLIEIDAASNTGVDDVRELRDKIQFAPNEGRYKVYIIDEVHMMSNSAFNALLKTLEEPPAHAVFILATTEEYKLPATVLSRCQRHTFRRIPQKLIQQQLQKICIAEGVRAEPEALEIVSHHATGAMRDALSLLDQLIVDTGEVVTAERARQVLGITQYEGIARLVEALAHGALADGLQVINQAVGEGVDARQFARQMTDYLRNLLLVRAGSADVVETTAEQRAVLQGQADKFSPQQLLHALNCFDEAGKERRGSWLQQLPLEMAFVRALQGTPVATPPASAPIPPQAQYTPPAVALPKGQAPARVVPPLQSDTSPQVATTPAVAHEPAFAQAPTVPEPVTSSTNPATNAASFQQVAGHWGEVVQRVRRYAANLPALLDWCRPVKLEGDKLLLGYKKQFALDKVSSPELSSFLQRAILEATGLNLHLQHVLRDVETDSSLPDIRDDGAVAMGVQLGAKPREIKS